LHPSANESFRASNDLEMIVQRYYGRRNETGKPGLHRSTSVGLSVMTPVKPMLAEAVKTIEVRFVGSSIV
jgi:DNA ligase-3